MYLEANSARAFCQRMSDAVLQDALGRLEFGPMAGVIVRDDVDYFSMAPCAGFLPTHVGVATRLPGQL